MHKGKRAFERTTRLSRPRTKASSSVVPFYVCGQARQHLSNKVEEFKSVMQSAWLDRKQDCACRQGSCFTSPCVMSNPVVLSSRARHANTFKSSLIISYHI